MSKWVVVALVIACIAIAANFVFSINLRSRDLDQQLFACLKQGYGPGVIQILGEGASAKAVDSHGCPTTLFSATIADPSITQMLLDKGAPANPGWSEKEFTEEISHISNIGGLHGYECATEGRLITPLSTAAEFGHFETAMALLDAGAKINPWDTIDESVIHCAARGGSTKLIEALIERGADVNSVGNNWESPLRIACWYSDVEMVSFLLDNGAKVNSTDRQGNTALFTACQRNNVEMVRILLEHGANATTANLWDRTPLFMACQQDNLEMVSILISNGATATEKCLDTATKRKNVEIISLLQASLDDQAITSQDAKEPNDTLED